MKKKNPKCTQLNGVSLYNITIASFRLAIHKEYNKTLSDYHIQRILYEY